MTKTGSRTSRRPPARLSWPESLSTEQSDNSKILENHRRKRPRFAQSGPAETVLWVDKFSPPTSIDLCVSPKKIKECKSWLQEATRCGGHSSRLLVLVGSPGVGKSTMVRVLAKELGLNVHSWNESFTSRDQETGNFDRVLSVERTSALDSFEEFLGQCGAGFTSLQLSTDNGNAPTRSIILLEDLPNLHGTDAEIRFRRIMTDHLNGSQVPTVLIYSDVSEGKHRPADLERLIDPTDLYSSSSLICQIQPTTKPKMKKILDKIANIQNCEIPSTFFEELHLQSGGDVRHAIMTLQLQATGLKSLPPTANRAARQNDRDIKLSTFHALGKMLYAKHKVDDNGKQILAFDPDAILERSDLGVGGSLRFLEYHSADFFTDIEDLDDAYALFSDAATLLDNPDTFHHQHSIFPWGCASSIAGRAVAYSNKHPAPNKFRQFSTPQVFDVLRNRRQNEVLLSGLAQRLSNCHLEPCTVIGGTHAFVTELLPVLRLIYPDVVNPSVDNFYSIARESVQRQAKTRGALKEDATLKVQSEILETDDIEDFDSDTDEKATNGGTSTNQLSRQEESKQRAPDVIVID